MTASYKSPLHQMAVTTPTDFWNDSCSLEDLAYAIENGAVGATSNPTIVHGVLKKDMSLWRDRIGEIIDGNPEWTENEVTWKLIEEMAVRASELLCPIFEREQGLKGRLSIQTNPAFYRSADRIVEQALHFQALAPNMQVKIPVTKAGIRAIEEATRAGISINATVCFTVPQALAVADAVERGLKAREAEGNDTAHMSPVCTIMVGRMDDWLHVLEKRDGIVVPPGYADWAGIACLKRAYGIYRERGYRTRLLAAAYRHHLHWSEFIGGDVILTMPCEWQRLFNASDVEVLPRFDNPVPTEILSSLLSHFPDFVRAYEPDGLSIDEFYTFGPTVRTLRGFIASYHDLIGMVRDFMLPNPDVR